MSLTIRLVHWMYVLEHTLLGSNSTKVNSIMMVRVRLGLMVLVLLGKATIFYLFFRRGALITENDKHSEWIYVIMSVSFMILI